MQVEIYNFSKNNPAFGSTRSPKPDGLQGVASMLHYKLCREL